ncbi:MAG TPA: hypothetical protein PLN68_07150, partial [Elusimicrobiales bacterium]|nr:hypothetical protein [Elusimicrobiales bacterium]
MKNIFKVLLVLAVSLGFNLYSADFSIINDKVIKDNFSILPSLDVSGKFSADVKASVSKPKVGDFSNIPNYAFSYLNNMVI